MAKQCAFCDFSDEDPWAFAEHVRTVHHWDLTDRSARPASRVRPEMVILTIGAMLAFGSCVAVNALVPDDGHGGTAEVAFGLGYVVVLVSVPLAAATAVLTRLRRHRT